MVLHLHKVFLCGDYCHFAFYMQRGSVDMVVVRGNDFSYYYLSLFLVFFVMILGVKYLAVPLDFSLCRPVMMICVGYCRMWVRNWVRPFCFLARTTLPELIDPPKTVLGFWPDALYPSVSASPWWGCTVSYRRSINNLVRFQMKHLLYCLYWL